MRTCGWCEAPIGGHRNRRYCNPTCRDNRADEVRRQRAEIYECPGCGGPFKRTQPSTTGMCLRCSRPRGERNKMFRGGLTFNKGTGRWCIVGRDRSFTLYYRAVMEAELGRPLGVDELVHHINGDPTDDRPENLQLIGRADHARLHAQLRREAA